MSFVGAEQEEKQTAKDVDSDFGLLSIVVILSALTFMYIYNILLTLLTYFVCGFATINIRYSLTLSLQD